MADFFYQTKKLFGRGFKSTLRHRLALPAFLRWEDGLRSRHQAAFASSVTVTGLTDSICPQPSHRQSRNSAPSPRLRCCPFRARLVRRSSFAPSDSCQLCRGPSRFHFTPDSGTSGNPVAATTLRFVLRGSILKITPLLPRYVSVRLECL